MYSSQSNYLDPSLFDPSPTSDQGLDLPDSQSVVPQTILQSWPDIPGHYACDLCGERFDTHASLSVHQHSHAFPEGSQTRDHDATQTNLGESIPLPSVGRTDVKENSDVKEGSDDNETIDDDGDMERGGSLHAFTHAQRDIPTSDPLVSSTANASAILPSTSIASSSQNQGYLPLRQYIPRAWDTSNDHTAFFCDQCHDVYSQRYLLQLHKANIHGLMEIPYLPSSGHIALPDYLAGRSENQMSAHKRSAFRVWQNGGLSTSPCLPCIRRNQFCIVSPGSSIRCALCHNYDNRSYCGAAGIKYWYVVLMCHSSWLHMLISI